MWNYRIRNHFRRLLRAWCYLRNTLSADDAQIIIIECQHAAGWHPLTILSTPSTLERAQEKFGDHASLASWVSCACARVGEKWSSDGEDTGYAEDWALDLVKDYAASDGVTLQEIEE